jgi:hypothetical protein
MTVGPNKVVDYAKREHLRKPSLLMRAHVSLFAAPPRKVSAAKMLRKPKEFAQHFKRHFLKRHLRVRVLPPQPGSRSPQLPCWRSNVEKYIVRGSASPCRRLARAITSRFDWTLIRPLPNVS